MVEPGEPPTEPSPLQALGALAAQTVAIDDELDHREIYTMEGLLTILWHGPADTEPEAAVVCMGGAMGGLLGPDGGLYQRLGRSLAALGIGLLRVGYRRPNHLETCVHDVVAAMELARLRGVERLATVGHSFGGAVAIQAAALHDRQTVPAIVTLATQSGGCEPAEQLNDRDLLYIHGTADTILPYQASEMVRMLAETGELWLIDGADHMLSPAGDQIHDRLVDHLPRVLNAVPD